MNHQAILGDVAEISPGTSIDRKRRTDAGVAVFGLDQVAGRPLELPPCIAESDLPKRTTRLRQGDVVLALVGRTGRAALVGPEYDGAVLDRECAALRVHDSAGVVTPEWLHLWARSRDCRTQMDAHTTGATIPRVPISAVRRFTLPLVSHQEQLAAAARLDDLEAALVASRDTVELLEQLLAIETDLAVYAAKATEQRLGSECSNSDPRCPSLTAQHWRQWRSRPVTSHAPTTVRGWPFGIYPGSAREHHDRFRPVAGGVVVGCCEHPSRTRRCVGLQGVRVPAAVPEAHQRRVRRGA